MAANNTSSNSSSSGVKHGLRLAFFASGGANAYQQAGLKAAVATAQEYGESMHTYPANFDNSLQLNQINEAIASGQYQGFVIEPINPGTVCGPVKAALRAHIVVALTNVQACDTTYEVPYAGTVGYVGGQATSVYKQWMEGAFNADPKGGEFSVLTGPSDQGNTYRAEQAWSELKPQYPQWKEVGGFLDTGYDAGPALTKTQDLLGSYPNLKLLFSNYSGQTPGAIAALKAAGKIGQVKIYDFGGDKEMFDALQAGTIAETIIMLPWEEQERGTQMVIAKLSGLTHLGPVTVGQFFNLTRDPKLGGLSPFVTKAHIAKYNARGLPEYG